MVLRSTLGQVRWGYLLPAALAFLLVFASVPWMPDHALPKWGVVWVAGIFAGLFLAWKPLTLDRIDVAALGLFAWAAVSVLWSPDRFEATDALTGIGPVVLIFLALRRIDAERIRDFIVPAAAVAIGAHYLFSLDPFGGFGNQNFLTEFLLIAAPLALLTPFGLLLAPACVGLAFFVAGWIELPVFALWLLLLASKRRFGMEVGIGVFALFSIIALSESVELWTAAVTRLDLWAGTIAAWSDAPLFGHGVGSFDYVFPAYGNAGLLLGVPPYSVESSTYPGAAHSDLLQLGMELGAVGFGIAAYLAWLVFKGSAGMPRVALLTAGALALIGFPFQNPATVVLIALAAAPSQSSPMVWLPRLAPVAAVAGLAWLLFLLPVRIEAQKHLSAGMRYLQPEVIEYAVSPKEALGNINAAFRLDAGNARIRVALFKTAELVDRRHPGEISADDMETTWRVALTASPLNPALLMTRLSYLARHGQCPDACMAIADALLSTAWRKQEVRWMVDRIWGKV